MTEGMFVFIRCSKLIFLNSTLSQVTINQSKIGEVVQQKPVWSVAITNGCQCSQLDMLLTLRFCPNLAMNVLLTKVCQLDYLLQLASPMLGTLHFHSSHVLPK